MAEKVIADKIKAQIPFVGYGNLTLTETALAWNKSKVSSYVVFGVVNVLTKDHLYLLLSEIVDVGKSPFTGDLVVRDKEFRKYKFVFRHKKDFKTVYEYLSTHIGG